MKKAVKSRFSEPWRAFADRWQRYYTPPGAPSKEAIKIFKKYTISKLGKKHGRILVLGATPEIRQMLYKIKAEITIVDINLEMIWSMSELIKNKHNDEIILRSDWLNMPLKDGYYDIILGDLVICNIERNKQSLFLKEIARLLKPKGYFITKIAWIPKELPLKPVDDVLKQYEKFSYYKTMAMEMFCYLFTMVWNEKKEFIDTGILKKKLKKYWSNNKYHYTRSKTVERALNDIWSMWKPLNKVWSYGCKAEELKRLNKQFKVLNTIVLNDCKIHAFDYSFPIIICEKK